MKNVPLKYLCGAGTYDVFLRTFHGYEEQVPVRTKFVCH